MTACPTCRGYHLPGYHEGEPHEYEDPRVVREGAWAILHDKAGMRKDGHGDAVTWASGYVDDVRPSRRPSHTLADDELERVWRRARTAVADSRGAGWALKLPADREAALEMNARGFGAELSLSRLTGLEWHEAPVKTRGYRRSAKPPDVGRRVEVKTTWYRDGVLRAYDGDRADFVFVLMIGRLPTFECVGWMEGRELLVPSRWSETPRGGRARTRTNPGWSATQDELRPLPLPDDA